MIPSIGINIYQQIPTEYIIKEITKDEIYYERLYSELLDKVNKSYMKGDIIDLRV